MLVALDFDGALAVSDPYVRLGDQAGTSADVAATLDRMAAGELDSEAGLRIVADHLEGLPEADAREAFDHVQLRDGAPALLSALHDAAHHVAIVSDAPEGAIRSHLEADTFDVDTVIANRLPTSEGALDGSIEGPLVGTRKDEALEQIATAEGLALEEAVAVGDDRRDLPMLQAAETGIAIDPVPVVEDQADLTVPSVERLRLRLAEREVV